MEKVRYPTVQQPNILAYRRRFRHPVRGVWVGCRGPGHRTRGTAPVTAGGRRPITSRMPPGWDVDLSDDYEWVPLRLPPDVTRVTASTRLSIEAEYRGWELTKVRLYTDGTRRVLVAPQEISGREPVCRRSAGAVDGRRRDVCRATPRCSWCRPSASTRWRSPDCAGDRTGAPRRRGCERTLATQRSRAGQHGVRGAISRTVGVGRRIRQGRPWAEHLGRTRLRLRGGGHRHRPGPARQPAPRLFRLPADRALLNRMGFNNHGAGELALRLARHQPGRPDRRQHRQDQGHPARGCRRRLRRQRATARSAGRLPGGQRQLTEHPRAA